MNSEASLFCRAIINMFLLEAAIELCINTQIEEQAWRGRRARRLGPGGHSKAEAETSMLLLVASVSHPCCLTPSLSFLRCRVVWSLKGHAIRSPGSHQVALVVKTLPASARDGRDSV